MPMTSMISWSWPGGDSPDINPLTGAPTIMVSSTLAKDNMARGGSHPLAPSVLAICSCSRRSGQFSSFVPRTPKPWSVLREPPLLSCAIRKTMFRVIRRNKSTSFRGVQAACRVFNLKASENEKVLLLVTTRHWCHGYREHSCDMGIHTMWMIIPMQSFTSFVMVPL